ncbi:hypothetical protein B0H16DRAFT_1476147 [Mycena metata]|uniref:Uncharacterized protein n=1 Tax=Mycena metata TaxID=1033252 RepID=A0AAD7HCM5_9AGAR|nr:hypothetical protein B0H16DRAFT_1476147 [Mycena metata]
MGFWVYPCLGGTVGFILRASPLPCDLEPAAANETVLVLHSPSWREERDPIAPSVRRHKTLHRLSGSPKSMSSTAELTRSRTPVARTEAREFGLFDVIESGCISWEGKLFKGPYADVHYQTSEAARLLRHIFIAGLIARGTASGVFEEGEV